MLSLLPQLLFLTPVATTLLRVVLGLYLVYEAWYLAHEQDVIMRTPLPMVGQLPAWCIWLGTTVYGFFGILLILGAWTQVVGLLAAIGMLKGIVYAPRYPNIVPFERATFVLLFCIALSLVATGAGAFGFDLPL